MLWSGTNANRSLEFGQTDNAGRLRTLSGRNPSTVKLADCKAVVACALHCHIYFALTIVQVRHIGTKPLWRVICSFADRSPDLIQIIAREGVGKNIIFQTEDDALARLEPPSSVNRTNMSATKLKSTRCLKDESFLIFFSHYKMIFQILKRNVW